jgi:uncharacterized membrane protein
MAGALVALVIGLSMLVWGLELIAIAALQGNANGTDARPAASTYLLMFIGLVVVNLATFYALTHWSRYLREHPKTKQFPVAILVSVLVLTGAAIVYGVATHSAWMGEQDAATLVPRQGFVAYEVVFATVMIATLVLLAVRWSPGYKRRPIED